MFNRIRHSITSRFGGSTTQQPVASVDIEDDMIYYNSICGTIYTHTYSTTDTYNSYNDSGGFDGGSGGGCGGGCSSE